MTRLLRLSVATGAAVLALTPAPSWGAEDTFTVNSTADVVPGGACTTDPGGCTLREAITAASADNDTSDQDRINLEFNTINPTVTVAETLPTIDEPVAISSTGLFTPTISGNNAKRIFVISTALGDDVSLSGLRLIDGFTLGSGAGLSSSAADLTVMNSSISSNAAGSGGAIHIVNGTGTIERSTIADNTAVSNGGGILANTALTVRRSTIAGNHADGGGGGILATGGTIESSTISGNSTNGTNAPGGGLYLAASPTVRNSTVSGNHSDGASSPGGGIFAAGGDVVVTNTIVANNTAQGAGTDDDLGVSSGDDEFQLAYTLLEVAPDAGNYNEIVPDSNIFNTDPGLSNLASFGGPTQTHRPNPLSPVIDQGASDETTDQRGFARLGQFANIADELLGVDIGAVEVRIEPPTFAGTTPASPSSDDTPQVFGAIPTGSDIDVSDPRVQLYTSNTGGSCTGVTGPEDLAGTFTGGGITVDPVPHNATTTFFGTLRTTYGTSICSPTSISYTQADPPVTTTPPPTTAAPTGLRAAALKKCKKKRTAKKRKKCRKKARQLPV